MATVDVQKAIFHVKRASSLRVPLHVVEGGTLALTASTSKPTKVMVVYHPEPLLPSLPHGPPPHHGTAVALSDGGVAVVECPRGGIVVVAVDNMSATVSSKKLTLSGEVTLPLRAALVPGCRVVVGGKHGVVVAPPVKEEEETKEVEEAKEEEAKVEETEEDDPPLWVLFDDAESPVGGVTRAEVEVEVRTDSLFSHPLVLRSRTLLHSCVGPAVRKIGASFRSPPTSVSPEANALVVECLEGIDVSQLIDYHCHVVGLGFGGTGCWVAPHMTDSKRHPFNHIKLKAFMGGVGVQEAAEGADQIAMARLITLIRGVRLPGTDVHMRAVLLAFDMTHDKHGTALPSKSTFHVPNNYTHALQEGFPDTVIATCSVHPYRKDALRELELAASRGITIVKWLPNSMKIDPADPLCLPFYDKMVELGMVLLSHTGEEHSVAPPSPTQEFGNPLRLRVALDRGLRVIAAHCSTEGNAFDLDNPPARATQFSLWLRLMRTPQYDGLLFGDISAVTAFKRIKFLKPLLEAGDIHHRLVYGSDYPVPCLNIVVQTSLLRRKGFITKPQEACLNELYKFNPLLFDLCVKRCLRAPHTGARFADVIYRRNPALERGVVPATGAVPPTSAGDVASPEASREAVAV